LQRKINWVRHITNKIAEAKLPNDKSIVYYISLIDERGFEVSSNHLILDQAGNK